MSVFISFAFVSILTPLVLSTLLQFAPSGLCIMAGSVEVEKNAKRKRLMTLGLALILMCSSGYVQKAEASQNATRTRIVAVPAAQRKALNEMADAAYKGNLTEAQKALKDGANISAGFNPVSVKSFL